MQPCIKRGKDATIASKPERRREHGKAERSGGYRCDQKPYRKIRSKRNGKGGQLCQASAQERISEERGHTRELLDRAGAISMKKAVEAQRKRRV